MKLMVKLFSLFVMIMMSCIAHASSESFYFYAFSSHPCTIVNADNNTVSFSKYSANSLGYYYPGTYNPGLTYMQIWPDTGFNTITANEVTGFKFKGWYRTPSDISSGGAVPTVNNASVLLETNRTLSYEKIRGSSKWDGYPVVMAKYVPLYAVATEAKPLVAGSTKGDSIYEQGERVTLTAVANNGYSFCRWEKDSLIVSQDNPHVFTADDGCDGTYVSVFTANVYTVTFSANGGDTPSPANKSVSFNSQYGALPSCSREGHSFDGWYTERSGGTKVSESTVFKAASDETLYAHWVAEKYTVEYYDASQFGGALLKSEEVAWGATATPPSSPVHQGWTFNEWTGWNGFDNVKQDRRYTATGRQNEYTVRYHADATGGPIKDEVFICYSSKNLANNQFTRTGYQYVGWDTNSLASVVVFEDGQMVMNLAWSGIFDLYAVWTPNHYRVVFDANGGSGTMADLVASYDEVFTVPGCAFVKDSSEFFGWRVEGSSAVSSCLPGDSVSNLTAVADGEVRFIAEWREFYTISYRSNGGLGEMSDDLVAINADHVLQSNKFTRIGYSFAGWATNATGSVVFENGAVVRNLADVGEPIELYAIWSANTYIVSFDANGGSGQMDDQTFVYDVTQALPTNGFSRGELWAFDSWSNVVSGATYQDGELVKNLATAGRVTLLATWNSDIGPLSEAMGCDNLKWIDGNYEGKHTGWQANHAMLDGKPSSVQHIGIQFSTVMRASIRTGGVLRFKWRPTCVGESLTVGIYAKEGNVYIEKQHTDYQADDYKYDSWDNDIEYEVPSSYDFESGVAIWIINQNIDYSECGSYITDLRWVPDGGDTPKYGEDDTPISSFGNEGGRLGFTFSGDGGVYHLLGTNELVAPMPWPVIHVIDAGAPSRFEIPINDSEPKMFYRIRSYR